MNKLFAALALAGAVSLASLSSTMAQTQDAIVIKFSHVVAPDTPKGKGAEKFKELAAKYTDGKVKVEVYPNSQLYKDKEELEALQLGAVHMLAPSLAKFGPLGAKEFEAFDLPFIFQDKAALRKVTEGPVGKELLGKLASKGIIGLAYWDNGFKIMSAKRPLKSPDDILRPQDAYPVVESAGSADEGVRRRAAGHGLLGGLPGPARQASSMAPRTRHPTCTLRRCTRCSPTQR